MEFIEIVDNNNVTQAQDIVRKIFNREKYEMITSESFFSDESELCEVQ